MCFFKRLFLLLSVVLVSANTSGQSVPYDTLIENGVVKRISYMKDWLLTGHGVDCYYQSIRKNDKDTLVKIADTVFYRHRLTPVLFAREYLDDGTVVVYSFPFGGMDKRIIEPLEMC